MRRRLFALLAFALLLAPLAVPGPALAVKAALPQVGANPGAGPPGTKFVIFGTGWTPNSPVPLGISRVRPDPTGIEAVAAPTDASGAFTYIFDSTGQIPGDYVVLSFEGSLINKLDFTITAPSGPLPGPSPSPAPAPPEGDRRCFPPDATTFCIAGAFRAQWEQHGGLPINGYPLSEVFKQRLEDGREYDVQYFERVRMELHADAQGRPLVLLGQFGRRLHPLDPPAAMQPGAAYFPETKHNLDGGFLAYWQANGDLAQFGYPLSEVFRERLEDGNEYDVQYFERARFEYHGTTVLLGQFGRRVLAETPR